MKEKKIRAPRPAAHPLFTHRTSGVLCHVSSLPGAPGTGDFGPSAFAFVDWLAEAGQSIWQVLPLSPVDKWNSPYASSSAFAGESMYVSPDLLAEESWIARGELQRLRIKEKRSGSSEQKCDFRKRRQLREEVIEVVFRALQKSKAAKQGLARYLEKERGWLHDFALFSACTEKFKTARWTDWPKEVRSREPATLSRLTRELADSYNRAVLEQWLFEKQWLALKTYAGERGVSIVGDVPIFINFESADVWAHQQFFLLDHNGRPRAVSGVPPDHFNPAGQLWGHVLYDWAALSRHGFTWWLDRFQRAFTLYDAVRIDHFIGFHRFWEIPATAADARRGTWRIVPGAELFNKLRAVRKRSHAEDSAPPVIAEDLGLLTKEVCKLRDDAGFPGMRVGQFGFSDADDAPYHMPHKYPPNSVCYPGTHDNDTVEGWFQKMLAAARAPKSKRKWLPILEGTKAYLGIESTRASWNMIRSMHTSAANTSIVSLQDVLGLKTAARMNTPGTATGNWVWRCPARLMSPRVADDLRVLTGATHRLAGDLG